MIPAFVLFYSARMPEFAILQHPLCVFPTINAEKVVLSSKYLFYSITFAFYSKDIVMPVRPAGYEWLKAHYQNKGIFPKRRREQFTELTDDEIARMQAAYRAIYEIV